jgi:hypothetical protein
MDMAVSPVAYHEAGHLLVAHALGATITSVDLDKRESRYSMYPDQHRQIAVVAMAGQAAEDQHQDTEDYDSFYHALADQEAVKVQAEALGITCPERIDAFCQDAKMQALDILTKQATALDALAREIDAKKCLQGDEIARIISQAT